MTNTQKGGGGFLHVPDYKSYTLPKPMYFETIPDQPIYNIAVYIRNALMCCGDTTLEGQSQAKMFEHIAGTDGTGAVHVCRNYDEISTWAEKQRTTDGKEVL
jgi:hypothetical protein